jgi:hypothetical protein
VKSARTQIEGPAVQRNTWHLRLVYFCTSYLVVHGNGMAIWIFLWFPISLLCTVVAGGPVSHCFCLDIHNWRWFSTMTDDDDDDNNILIDLISRLNFLFLH